MKQLLLDHGGIPSDPEILGDGLHAALTAILEESVLPIFGDIGGIRHGRILVGVRHNYLAVQVVQQLEAAQKCQTTGG